MRTLIARSSKFRVAVTAAALFACSGLALAQPAPTPPPADRPTPADAPPPPPPAPLAAPVPLEGTVDGFNLGPNGNTEGVLLKTDKGVAQVNFSPEMAMQMGQSVKVGDTLKLDASPAPMSPPDHPVYELASVTIGGKQFTAPRPGMPGTPAHAEGKVKTVNFARDGRPNGAVLEDGTFVHVGPDAAAKLDLKPGVTLKVNGDSRPTLTGPAAIDARNVNGTDIPRPAPRPRGPGGPGGPPPARDGMPPVPPPPDGGTPPAPVPPDGTPPVAPPAR